MTDLDFTPEAEPSAAALIFGDRIETARKYTAALVRDGETYGLLGPREYPKIWTRHVLNSAVVAELVSPGQTVGDVGSGPDCREYQWRLPNQRPNSF